MKKKKKKRTAPVRPRDVYVAPPSVKNKRFYPDRRRNGEPAALSVHDHDVNNVFLFSIHVERYNITRRLSPTIRFVCGYRRGGANLYEISTTF